MRYLSQTRMNNRAFEGLPFPTKKQTHSEAFVRAERKASKLLIWQTFIFHSEFEIELNPRTHTILMDFSRLCKLESNNPLLSHC